MSFEKGAVIREGKAKILYETASSPDHLIQFFKDDATAFNGIKKGTIADKGVINNAVSTLIFRYLEKQGVPTHFVESNGDREMVVKRVEIVPVEMVVRNKAAGSLCKRLGIEKARVLDPPLVEYFYKSDELSDPVIGENHIRYFNWASDEDLGRMRELSLQVNTLLRGVFRNVGLDLIDFKLEFGKDARGNLLLADEFTPDGCRLWDLKTGEVKDKDRFRHDMGSVEESYQDVLKRLEQHLKDRI